MTITRWSAALAVVVAACEGPVGGETVGGASAPLMTATSELFAADGAEWDGLGEAVDLDGDTIIASADGAAPAGAAYVFVRGTSGWAQQAKLVGSDSVSGDAFGRSVAVSGDWALVGAPYRDNVQANVGAAYLYYRSAGTWTQMDRLEAGTRRLNMQFGTSVAIRGDTAVVGAPADPILGSGSGSVWIFVHDGAGNWTQQAELRASDGDAGDEFGYAVDIDGDDLIVGARTNEGRWYEIDSGTVYFFERSGTSWTQTQRLRASDSENYSEFGNAVAISGDTAMVGAWKRETSLGRDSGATYVLERSGGTWSETQRLVGTGLSSTARFGTDVELEGGTALIGAPNFWEGSVTSAGTAFVFLRGATWFEWDRFTASLVDDGDRLGYGVAMQGDRVVLGAPGDEAGTAFTSVGGVVVHDMTRLADGESCSYDPECTSGFCVDGVCCDTACGGGASDCMACSVTAGGSVDGTCGALSVSVAATVTCRPATGPCDLAESCVAGDTACPADEVASAGTLCRDAAGDCDIAESCDGSSAACPPDVVRPDSIVCRTSAGPCDLAESCDGVTGTCPADAVAPATTECRAAVGVCDLAESCDGSSADCPANAVASAGTVCRASAGPCDAEEACDGSAVNCPADAPELDGTSCDDGMACNGEEVCEGGACTPGSAPDCDDGNPCTADMCAEPGGCAHEAIEGCCVDDAGCDDGDACTTDRCDPATNTCSNEAVSGCGADAGAPDAGTDGGTDAGSTRDAGAPGSDAGGGSTTRERGGCGCRVVGTPHTSPPWLALLLAPAAIRGTRRWRRRRR